MMLKTWKDYPFTSYFLAIVNLFIWLTGLAVLLTGAVTFLENHLRWVP